MKLLKVKKDRTFKNYKQRTHRVGGRVSTSLAGTVRTAIGANPCLLIPSRPSPSRQHSCTSTHHPLLHLYPSHCVSCLPPNVDVGLLQAAPPQHLKAMPSTQARVHPRTPKCYTTVTTLHRVDRIMKRIWSDPPHTTTYHYANNLSEYSHVKKKQNLPLLTFRTKQFLNVYFQLMAAFF